MYLRKLCPTTLQRPNLWPGLCGKFYDIITIKSELSLHVSCTKPKNPNTCTVYTFFDRL